MRDVEFYSKVCELLAEIRDGVVRVAEACERAERWTTGTDVTSEVSAAALLEPDALTASTEAECGPLGGEGSTRPRPDAGKRKRGRK